MSKCNPMSKEFQEEAKRRGMTGYEYMCWLRNNRGFKIEKEGTEEEIRRYLEQKKLEEKKRKTKMQFFKKTKAVYRKRVAKKILPLIVEGIEASQENKVVMGMVDIKEHLGQEFSIYADFTVYRNLKIVLEEYDIATKYVTRPGLVTVGGMRKGKILFLHFKNRGDEQYIWEKKGFSSRKEYEEFLRYRRNCRYVEGKIAENKDPDSIFSNPDFARCMTGCSDDE